MDRTAQILAYIAQYRDEHGYPPSLKEIADGCEISSTSVVRYWLDRLQAAGRLTWQPGQSRTLRLTPAG